MGFLRRLLLIMMAADGAGSATTELDLDLEETETSTDESETESGEDAVGEDAGGAKGELPPWGEQLSEKQRAQYKDLLASQKDIPFTKLYDEYAALKADTRPRVPGEDASEEERAAYLKSIGVPDSPEGYKLEPPQMPDGMSISKDLEAWFRQAAFANHIPEEGVKAMFADYNKMQIQRFSQITEARRAQMEKATADLQKEWGDDYAKKSHAVELFFGAFGGPEVFAKIKGAGLDNDPVIIKAFADAGEKMLGSEFFDRSGAPGTSQEEGDFHYGWMREQYPEQDE